MAEIKKSVWSNNYYVTVNDRIWSKGLSYEEAEAVATVLNNSDIYVGGGW